MDLEAIPFIPAGNGGGAVGRPRLIVLHGMVNAGGIRRGAAKACASYFSSKTTKYYAHYSLDPGEVYCSVHPTQKAPHVGNANWYAGGPSIGIEQACYCDVRDNWDTGDGQAEVALAADLTRSLCDEFDITPRWLTIEELRAGRDGITDHYTAGRALGGSDHTDPGPKYPTAQFMGLVTRTPTPFQEDTMATLTDEQAGKLIADVSWTAGQIKGIQDALTEANATIKDVGAHVKIIEALTTKDAGKVAAAVKEALGDGWTVEIRPPA